jgi:hypothetical protein
MANLIEIRNGAGVNDENTGDVRLNKSGVVTIYPYQSVADENGI